MSDIVRIPFHSGEVLTLLVDGKPHVVLRPAIERLGMDYPTQFKKLRRRSWAVVGQSPTTGADGKSYQMTTVDVRTFLMLLATIDEHRVAEAVRPLLLAYQAEVADVLEAYWNTGKVDPASRDLVTVLDDQVRLLEIEQVRHRHRAEEAELQLSVLGTGVFHNLLSADWARAKAQHVVARVLGEEPEIDPATRPVTVGEYLAERDVTGSELRSISPAFGKHVKTAYRALHLQDPPTIPRFVDGAIRSVSGYSEVDRPLFDEVWHTFYARDVSKV